MTVVGEPGVGKSTLVSRVLGQNALSGVELAEAPWQPGGAPLAAVTDTDGVLLAVPATGVWGAGHSRLLEDAVAAHVTSIGVVVTMLDRLGAAERGRVLTYISARVGRITVLSGPGAGPEDPATAAVRAFLVDSAPPPGRAELRARRIAARLADQCTAMATSAGETIADARRVHSGQSIDQRSTRARAWELLRVQLSDRQLALIGRIGEHLRTDRAAVLKRLTADLSRVGEDRAWWHTHLPNRLRAELMDQAMRAEHHILTGIATDADWLAGQLADRTPWRPSNALLLRVDPPPTPGTLATVTTPTEEITVPLPDPARGLPRAVEGTTAILVNQIWRLLASAYEPLFTHLAERQSRWEAEQAATPDQPTTDWHTLAKSATALAGTINAALRAPF
ncbi:GTPase domain-containing protein [Actinokineospora globicatena]|uniref:GTPase domain-containing protein n=1 Tax=Actinokineospora globicatena TaxID=103729 RepID=UPI0020A48814|nr:GTPase domain-containing protein [Actinokineospora globicatena]GLW75539.1 hypothetical protein Aglo01_00210 [Actinokineospora globicatena]GLW82380.1 hypothetical protein Aglo02_00210 [Actinokineospora globicatena]